MTQERRRGPDNNLSGPALSGDRSNSLTGPPIGIEPPGRDDKPRAGTCDSCKVPATTTTLMPFRLWSLEHSRWAGEWTLCQKCWEWRNERPNPDPLHVEEDAA